MKITTVNNAHQQPYFIFIYGASGAGKTSLLKTLPIGKTLMLDAEQGTKSIGAFKFDLVELCRDDDGKLLPEKNRFERFDEFCEFLLTPEAQAKYDYVFVDSLTEISQNLKNSLENGEGEDALEGWAMWGEYNDTLMRILKFFRDIGHYTVIMTAIEDRVDDKDGTSYYAPMIQGKQIKAAIQPLVDELLRLVVVDDIGTRKLICQPTTKTKAKDRSGNLDAVEDPHLMNLITKMYGKDVQAGAALKKGDN
jgi:phage nucleotide-binding protein